MINLMDTYNQASWDLHYSLVRSGYDHPTIAINDDGFLPADVTSPYLYYTGFEEATGHPLYFNQVPVPDYWEIRADGSQGEIFNYAQKRGHIHYTEPKHQRLVQAVDWYDEQGRVRVIDRYNKFGYRYAQTVRNLQGDHVLTSYFNREGREVIVENHQTGDIILNEQDQVFIFKNKVDFVMHYLRVAGFDLDRIFYNSLSTPFLVAFYMGGDRQDVLFWQEPIGDEIPGNMRILLDDKGRKTTVLVQDRVTYEKMLPLLSESDKAKVAYLGFLYPFNRYDLDRKQAAILTNSDQLEQIEPLLEAHPDIDFHIGALTEMSSKLTALSRYPHVHLYPNISIQRARQLLQTCGLYLDINHHTEILSAVRTAFENGLVIAGFTNTIHQAKYTAPELIFAPEHRADLSQALTRLTQEEEAVQTALKSQERQANLVTIVAYQAALG